MSDAAGRSGGLLRERMIIRRTAEMLVAASPPDVLFPRVCDLLASQFGAHFVAILDSGASRAKLRVRWGFSAADESPEAAIAEVSPQDIDPVRSTVHPIAQDRVVLFVPLRYGSATFGYLTLCGSARRFTRERVTLLETCARYIAVAISNVALCEEKERLEALATTDALTGIPNRRVFDERLEREWRRAVRSREPLSIVMADVDYFKAYNDAYGHVAGDRCLQQVALALMSCVSRGDDLVARYGGEEFVALLPNTTESGATEVAERMCRKVADLAIVHRGSELDRVSISVGVGTAVPRVGDRAHTLINAADKALYRAKEGGRNRAASSAYVGEAPRAGRRFEGRNNLPIQLTSFVGREGELATAVRALPTSPVISILGPGGVGKTRFALALAQAALASFPGGVWLIEVGAERDGARLPEIVAKTLGLRGLQPTEEVLASLSAAPALLVVDSCEHLLDACKSLCAQILARCPEARIVTTSRQPLRIPGELGLRLEPFSPADAMKLFVARAREAVPEFALGPYDEVFVRDICMRVDCLPLGIELAALRVRDMSLQQLAEHGSALPHPTGLHERVAWSFDLLAEAERRFLARLSVLRGPFDEETALAVAGTQTFDPGLSFEMLTRLVEKSLVQLDLESGRYRLLSTIAEYLRPRLLEFDDPRAIRAAATQHYAARLAALRSRLQNGSAHEVFARYAALRENVESVLETALGGEDVETGAALAADMTPFWMEIGHLACARPFLDQAIAHADRLSRRRLLDVLEAAVEVAAAGSDAEYLEKLAERLRAETGTSNDGAEVARVMLALALTRNARGQFEEAASLFHHASNAFRGAGDARSLARSLLGWSEIVADIEGDVPRALSLLNEALEAARGSGSPALVLDVVSDLVDLTSERGDDAEAIGMLGDLAAQSAEFEDDASSAATTLLLAREELRSDPIVGRMHARDALERLRAHAHPGRLAECFELFARIAVDAAQDDVAARLLAFAASLRRTHGVAGRTRARRAIARLREIVAGRMERAAYERALREGRAMTLEAAVQRAMTAGEAHPPGSAAPILQTPRPG
jgi:diguanylate cyclase (GGDEF)-like protein